MLALALVLALALAMMAEVVVLFGGGSWGCRAGRRLCS